MWDIWGFSAYPLSAEISAINSQVVSRKVIPPKNCWLRVSMLSCPLCLLVFTLLPGNLAPSLWINIFCWFKHVHGNISNKKGIKTWNWVISFCRMSYVGDANITASITDDLHPEISHHSAILSLQSPITAVCSSFPGRGKRQCEVDDLSCRDIVA